MAKNTNATITFLSGDLSADDQSELIGAIVIAVGDRDIDVIARVNDLVMYDDDAEEEEEEGEEDEDEDEEEDEDEDDEEEEEEADADDDEDEDEEEDEDEDEDEDSDPWTKSQLKELEADELKALAKEFGVKVKKNMKASAIIAAIIAAEAAEAEGDDEEEEGEEITEEDLEEMDLKALKRLAIDDLGHDEADIKSLRSKPNLIKKIMAG